MIINTERNFILRKLKSAKNASLGYILVRVFEEGEELSYIQIKENKSFGAMPHENVF